MFQHRSIYCTGIIAYISIISFLTGCKKLVDVPSPVTSITTSTVFNSDATAISALTALYIDMSQANISGNSFDITTSSFFAGLSADELTLFSGANSPGLQAYYDNALSADPSNSAGSELWMQLYTYLYQCNAAIDGLNSSSGLTPEVKQQLLGEAKFMRALYYFYLVNYYGPVPLAVSSDYKANSILPRAQVSAVYQQIIADLSDAQNVLTPSYVGSDAITLSGERTRPNKWAALALLARTYLYTKNYDSAFVTSSLIINNSLYSLTGLDSVFLMNSPEAIWQLQPTTTGVTNTQDAYIFVIPPGQGPNSINMVYLSSNLLGSFEPGDLRRANWVDSSISGSDTFYFPFKYQAYQQDAPVSEYTMILRLGEQYLIRAEAQSYGAGNGITGAISDLNVIRSRAGLPAYSGPQSEGAVQSAIMHERQVELFTELGQRWLDLKRTGTVDAVMTPVTPEKGGLPWSSYQQLYPLPVSDIQTDSYLTQNSGY